MRLEHSLKNSAAVLGSQILSMALSFVTRTVFIRILTQEYLGLNGLFFSFLSLLSLSELGIGSAITFALYKPLAEKNETAISALMNFYAKSYKIIGVVITVLGFAAYPFMEFFVGDLPQVEHIYIIYLLFLLNTSLSYFFSYKRSLITADQQDWICVINQSAFLILQNVLQIILLLFTREYLLYLAFTELCVMFSAQPVYFELLFQPYKRKVFIIISYTEFLSLIHTVDFLTQSLIIRSVKIKAAHTVDTV